MLNKTWCSLPWQGIVIQPWGKIQTCCYTDDVSGNNIKEYLQSQKLNELKKQMLDNTQPSVCNVCWKTELSKNKSWRQKKNLQLQQYITKDQANDIGYYSFDYIELYISNKCNSKCRMCKPKWSTYWFSDYKDPIIKEIFNYSEELEKSVVKYNKISKELLEELLEIINRKKTPTTISLRGGEPCYAEETYFLLENIKNKKLINLDLTTNGTIVNKSLLDLLKQFKSIHLGVSIDASDKLNIYIRGNKTPIKKIIENTKSFLELDNICNFFVSNTIMIYNIFDNKILKNDVSQHLGFLPFFDDKFLFNPMHLKCSILPNFVQNYIEEDFIKKFIIQDASNSELIKKWVKYTIQLDKLRNESLIEIEPKFKILYDYIGSIDD